MVDRCTIILACNASHRQRNLHRKKLAQIKIYYNNPTEFDVTKASHLKDNVRNVVPIRHHNIAHLRSRDLNSDNFLWWFELVHDIRHNFRSIDANDLFPPFDVQHLRVTVSPALSNLELLLWEHLRLWKLDEEREENEKEAIKCHFKWRITF